MKTIPLTQGKVALVDDEDFERLNAHKWCALKGYNTFYAVRNSPMIQMHRDILNAAPGRQVDHADGNGTNNQKQNLRVATHQQNHWNECKRANTSSRFKGIDWHKTTEKWRARIRIDGKLKHLGLFADEVEAARAYDKAAREFFGEFARLNFSDKSL